jgi:hypothetical protein
MKFQWTWIACLLFMTSCGKEIPNDVIQPEKMEKVLYDYHLIMGMSENSLNVEREARRNYIFQKHGINKATFDSSMVWYTREAKELMSIYESLNKRFKREYEHIERLLESREDENTRTSVSGDTVDIWRKENLLWFSQSPLKKQLVFEIRTDTTFHPKDAFLWSMDYSFFTKGEAIMGLNVVYENDSVIGLTKSVTQSGNQSIYLHTDSTYKIKNLNGFIYVLEDTTEQTNILIHEISLTRYHANETKDSLSISNEEKTKTIPQKNKEIPKKVDNQRKRAKRMLEMKPQK